MLQNGLQLPEKELTYCCHTTIWSPYFVFCARMIVSAAHISGQPVAVPMDGNLVIKAKTIPLFARLL